LDWLRHETPKWKSCMFTLPAPPPPPWAKLPLVCPTRRTDLDFAAVFRICRL
jgi:hypothetical protein